MTCALALADGLLGDRVIYQGLHEFVVTAQVMKLLVLLAVWLLGLVSVSLGLLAGRRWVRGATAVLLLLGLGFNYSYLSLHGLPMGYDDMLVLLQNTGFGLEAEVLRQYAQPLMLSIALAIAVSIGLVALSRWLRLRLHHQLSAAWAISLPVAVAATFGVMELTNGNRTGFTAAVKLPSLLGYALTNGVYQGDRDEPAMLPQGAGVADHIILVVDESVRGDYLQINGHPTATTPYLTSQTARLLNFGIASSACVCSNFSHHVLMSGMHPEQVPDTAGESLRQPSLFQYAKQAGFATALVYAPGRQEGAHGYLTPYDLEDLDHRRFTWQEHPQAPLRDLDRLSIPVLAEVLDQHERTFTYLLKSGAHFNYEDAYPDTLRHFTPVLDPLDYSFSDPLAMRNSYRNAIRFAVDDFFRALDSVLAGRSALVVYTGDHGQNVLDEPQLKMTHCIRGAAPSVMANVPLLMYSPDTALMFELRQEVAAGTMNQGSHFDVPGTVLQLLGYDPAAIESSGYSNLLRPLPQRERVFYSGDLFGRSPSYRNVFRLPDSL